MMDVPIPPELVQDPFERNVPGFGFGRDPVRTPMPWTSEQYAGFSAQQPWLPLNADSDTLNVQVQNRDPRSMLSLYRALIKLRRENDVLSLGSFELSMRTTQVLVYERRLGERRYLIALNMSGDEQVIPIRLPRYQPLLSTYMDNEHEILGDGIHVRPDEGLVLRLLPTSAT
jgi:alpha-glucosidase